MGLAFGKKEKHPEGDRVDGTTLSRGRTLLGRFCC